MNQDQAAKKLEDGQRSEGNGVELHRHLDTRRLIREIIEEIEPEHIDLTSESKEDIDERLMQWFESWLNASSSRNDLRAQIALALRLRDQIRWFEIRREQLMDEMAKLRRIVIIQRIVISASIGLAIIFGLVAFRQIFQT
ncbi:MAG: hypothetical protein NUW37_01825 [Planctomycetes bacterium]|nr:hypothetical protein [Planctomycetota bacterium]